MSGHHKNTNDTLVNSQMLNLSVAEIVKRVHLDCEHNQQPR
jgi:hypothetical protein